MIVRTLLTRLGFTLNQSQLNGALNATNRLQNAANNAAQAFQRVALAFAGFSLVRQVVSVGDAMQSLEARMGLMPQSNGDTAASFDEVAKRAAAARTPLNAYATLYTRIGNASEKTLKTQEEVLAVTDVIAKSLVVGGATTQEAMSTMIQMSQAIGSGKLQGDEFRALTESAPQLVREIAKELNIKQEDLKKAASDGKITSEKLVKALLKMQARVHEQFLKMPITAGQAMQLVSDRFSKMINQMNRESLFITKIADLILSAFDWVEKGIKDVVEYFGGWEKTLRIIASTLSVIAAVKLAQLAAFLAPWARSLAIFALIGTIIEDIYVWMKGGDSLAGKLFGDWDAAKQKKLEGFFENLRYIVGFIAEKIKELKESFNELIGAKNLDVGGILLAGFAIAFALLPSLVFSALTTLSGFLLSFVSTAVTWFLRLGLSLGGFIVRFGVWGLMRFIAFIPIALTALKGLFVTFFTGIPGMLLAAFAVGFGVGTLIYDKFAVEIADMVDATMKWIDNFKSSLGIIWDEIKNGFTKAWSGAIDKAAQLLDWLFGKAKSSAFEIGGGFGAGISESAKQIVGGLSAQNFKPQSFNPTSFSGNRSVSSTTNINLTVPAGTTAEQGAFIKTAAKTAFGGGDSLARDLSVYSV